MVNGFLPTFCVYIYHLFFYVTVILVLGLSFQFSCKSWVFEFLYVMYLMILINKGLYGNLIDVDLGSITKKALLSYITQFVSVFNILPVYSNKMVLMTNIKLMSLHL